MVGCSIQFPKDGKRMRSNRLGGYLAMAGIIAAASVAAAQGAAVGNPESEKLAQATPLADPATEPPPPATVPAPAAPETAVPHLPEEAMRKIAAEEMAKGVKPRPGDVHFNGYFRIGYGIASKGGRQVCFQAPGAISKWRLGNECDQYGEFLFSGPAWVGDNGVVATANVMFNAFIPSTTQGYVDRFVPAKGELGRDLHFGSNQFFFDFAGVPFLGAGAHAWIGRRFYKRENIDTIDYFWWNASGLGGGIEDLALGGPLKLSVAVFEQDGPGQVNMTDPTQPSLPLQSQQAIRPDVRVYGITVPGGQLVLGVNPVVDVSSGTGTNNGFSATAMHVSPPIAGGNGNKLAVQYGVGSAVGDNGVFGSLLTKTNTNFIRVLDHVDFQLTPELGGEVLAVFNRYSRDEVANTPARIFMTAGARLSYAVHDNAQLLADAGFDTVKADGSDRRNLFKISVAPAITANKKFWGRPQLRLFGTLAFWNDAAKTGVDSAGIYATKNVGATFGMQGEAWW
jgi:maltoporin